jgi:hypothetical protein
MDVHVIVFVCVVLSCVSGSVPLRYQMPKGGTCDLLPLDLYLVARRPLLVYFINKIIAYIFILKRTSEEAFTITIDKVTDMVEPAHLDIFIRGLESEVKYQ